MLWFYFRGKIAATVLVSAISLGICDVLDIVCCCPAAGTPLSITGVSYMIQPNGSTLDVHLSVLLCSLLFMLLDQRFHPDGRLGAAGGP